MHFHLPKLLRGYAPLQFRSISAFVFFATLQSCNNDARSAAHVPNVPKSSPETFIDCAATSGCPDMIKLPRATYVMGSPTSELGRFDDENQHPVAVASFAIARTPVTRGQWFQFARDTKRITPNEPCAYAPGKAPSWENPGYPQSDNHPVVCVTWNDTQDYAAWLSKRTGKHYRLPTDEEWEYAARGGATTAFPWGASASHAFANYGLDDCCGPATKGRDTWEYTSPVGSFAPNSFGLVDIAGNVFEWVQTCADNFEKLPLRADGRGCTYRYARGGAYGERPTMMRSAAKNLAPPDNKVMIEHYRSAGFGFRVARDL